MKIVQNAMSGTYESSDLFVKVSPASGELDVVIDSEVFKQFGDQITKVVHETLSKLGIEEGVIIIEDKGALDCVIRARVQSAVLRASKQKDTAINWGIL